MTYDELLQRVKSKFINNEQGATMCVTTEAMLRKSLISVVELHKPVQGSSDIQTYDYIGCDACVEWSHDGNMNLEYPCPTIQAIEKVLA